MANMSGGLVVDVGEVLLCRGYGLAAGEEVWVYCASNPRAGLDDYQARRERLPDHENRRGIDDVVRHRVARGRVTGPEQGIAGERGLFYPVEVLERDS